MESNDRVAHGCTFGSCYICIYFEAASQIRGTCSCFLIFWFYNDYRTWLHLFKAWNPLSKFKKKKKEEKKNSLPTGFYGTCGLEEKEQCAVAANTSTATNQTRAAGYTHLLGVI